MTLSVIDHEQIRAALQDAKRYRLIRQDWFLQENLDWYETPEAFDLYVDELIAADRERAAVGAKQDEADVTVSSRTTKE